MAATSLRSRFDLGLLVEEGTEEQHICATCTNKQRVTVTTQDGSKVAAMWRCRTLTQLYRTEIFVQPNGSCFESRSMADYWEMSEQAELIW